MFEFKDIYKFLDENVLFIWILNRKKKFFLLFVGDLLKFLFGIVIMDDVNILK